MMRISGFSIVFMFHLPAVGADADAVATGLFLTLQKFKFRVTHVTVTYEMPCLL